MFISTYKLKTLNWNFAFTFIWLLVEQFCTVCCSLCQVRSCFAENDGVFLPAPKVKILEPRITTPTLLPVTERDLWGIRLWQVVGLAFVGTILLSEYQTTVIQTMIRRYKINVKVKHFYFWHGSSSSHAEFNFWDCIALLYSLVNKQYCEFKFIPEI